ncbi:MAG: hypothetical protein KA831_09710 [Pyrinomonadaceae bacterium]|nr:hypothetical protein [Pyrinomonadaceae bacterium]
MKLFNLKKLAVVTALGVVTILGTGELANAQGRGRDRDWKDDKKQEKQERKTDQRRISAQQQQQILVQQRQQQIAIRQQRQQQILLEQQRQAELRRQAERNRQYNRSGNDRSNGNGYYNGNANANSNRYRVVRNGSYYNTDQRGAELLRQAVNAGYRQGFEAGRRDLDSRRRISYSNSNVYQSGTYGYQSYVTQSQYQYYFRQGFQRGYQDGANSRYRDQYNNNSYGQYSDYEQQYQYGTRSNGVLNILGSILGQILNVQTY